MRLRRILLALCAPACLLAVLPALGEEEFFRPEVTAADLPEAHVDWFGLYMDRQKIGWVREETGRTGEADSAVLFQEFGMHIRLVSRGQTLEMSMTERDEFDPGAPYALRAARKEESQTGIGRELVELVRSGEGFTATIEQNGETRTREVGPIDFTLADSIAGSVWVRGERSADDRTRVRELDFDKLGVKASSLTFVARKEAVVGGVPLTFFEVTQRSAKGTEGLMRVTDRGRLLSAVFGGRFEARKETEETAKRIEASSDLFVLGMAKIDKPLGDPRKVRNLVLAVDGEGASKLEGGPRQRVTRSEKDGSVIVTLGPSVSGDETVTAADAEPFLAETIDYPIGLPQVAALAARGVGDAKTPREKVERLVRFVAEYVRDADLPRHVTVAEIVAKKEGDCSEHALLFTALARAAGVPAREVSGLMYMGDDVRAFGAHAWSEVVLDGRWVPVDPTWNETELDAAHLTLNRDGHSSAMLETLGHLTFRVQALDRAP